MLRFVIASVLLSSFAGCQNTLTGDAKFANSQQAAAKKNSSDDTDAKNGGKGKDAADGPDDQNDEENGTNDPNGPNGPGKNGDHSDDFGAKLGTTAEDAKPDPSVITEDDKVQRPTACTTANVKFGIEGPESQCPANYAAYTADDSKNFIVGCCPLPARDMLVREPAVLRGAQCGANEVATGASNSGLLCSKLNTARYKLSAPQATCYIGEGFSGFSGSTTCSVPTVTLQALVSHFGSDGCIGVPYGSLIIARNGKNCSNVFGVQVLYNDTGAPVAMFQ